VALTSSVTADTTITAFLVNELTVEDGSGKVNADSYLSLAEADRYASEQPDFKTWNNLTDNDKRTVLRQGAHYLDSSYRFYGKALTTTQNLQWPRTKNFTNEGLLLAQGIIPEDLKRAQIVLAVNRAVEGELFEASEGEGSAKSFKTEGLTVDFETRKDTLGSQRGRPSREFLPGRRFVEVELLIRAFGIPRLETDTRITEQALGQ